MDVKQLRCVEAVARHRNFTRAAEDLHLTQSAVSHQVSRLETELGIELFERTSRRVTPTEAGSAIAARGRRVLTELEEARQEVDQFRGLLRGRIWIGPLLRAGDLDVPGVLARFSQRHPGIEIGLREGLADEMLRYLAQDEIDAAFCLLGPEIPEGFAAERLGGDEAVAVFRPDAAPPGKRVGVTRLEECTIVGPRRGSPVTRALVDRFAEAEVPLHLALESGDPVLLRSLAARGFAAAMLPRSLAELDGPAVELRSLDPPARLTVALVWRRDREPPPAARTFIAFVRDEVGLVAD